MDNQPLVHLLDDDESVVVALRRMLQSEGYAIRTWTSAVEFLNGHDPYVPGCVVTDVLMPGMSGLELQNALAISGSQRPIIFVTGQGDIPMSVQAMRAGAVTFLPKPVLRADLVAAVNEALSKDLAIRTLQREQEIIRMRLVRLTPRERQVLDLVVRGMLNKQIAGVLGAAEKTIKVHRGRLLAKMEVRSAAGLVNLLAHMDAESADSAQMASAN